MKKPLILFALISVTLGVCLLMLPEESEVSTGHSIQNNASKLANESSTIKSVKKAKKAQSNKVVTLKSIEDRVSLSALELGRSLSPPDDNDLTEIWKQSYGCPKQNMSDPCLFASILTAESYEEALWMKRNGFPHFNRLSAAANDENFPFLEELAQAGFKPALSLTAKILSSLGQHDKAMKRAVLYAEQSSREEIYAYRLMGEIGAAADPLNPYVIRDYQMAAILGDTEARRLAINYAQNAEIMEAGMQLLLDSLGVMYGMSRDLIPTDPRPPKP